MGSEIERKFIVEKNDLDQFDLDEGLAIQQAYLAIEASGREVRIRKKGTGYFLTVKSGAGLRRDEWEVGLSKEQFNDLLAAADGRIINKRRIIISERGIDIEIDVYEGQLRGLIVAEIEFESEEQARSFSPPAWLGKEITGIKALSNQVLWQCRSFEELKEKLSFDP